MTSAAEEADRQLALLIASSLGDRIERALRDKTSPFANMLEQARAAYVQSVISIVEVDLNTPRGVDEAKSLQAEARRYRDLTTWVNNALEAAEQADEDINEEDGDGEAAATLKEMINGKRSTPAPDA